MPKQTITFDTVRRIGLGLPGVEEGTMYGTPALKLKGKLLTCIPSHKSAEPNSLAMHVRTLRFISILSVLLLTETAMSQFRFGRAVADPDPEPEHHRGAEFHLAR